MKKKSILLLGIGAMALLFTACQGGGTTTEEPAAASPAVEDAGPADAASGQASVADDESSPNVVGVAVGSPDHTTLVAAVQAGGLVDALANNGPFTVFAPTNAAFEALPEGTVENLLKPENLNQLQNVLKYHVAAGMFKLEYLSDGYVITQAQMGKVTMNKVDDGWTVNGANILGTVQATNGVVHVIDAVLLPPAE